MNTHPAPVTLGQIVGGVYLGQPFTGEVIAVSKLSSEDRFRITLHLDTPVDVVKFDSFSALRRRISATIDQNGITQEKTSDGHPQLTLNLQNF